MISSGAGALTYGGVTLSNAVTGTGSLSSPGTAEILCKVGDTAGVYMDRSITAIQVESLG